jgi:hypothetical protein
MLAAGRTGRGIKRRKSRLLAQNSLPLSRILFSGSMLMTFTGI